MLEAWDGLDDSDAFLFPSLNSSSRDLAEVPAQLSDFPWVQEGNIETQLSGRDRLKCVSAMQELISSHACPHPAHIQISKFIPVCGDHDRVGSIRNLQALGQVKRYRCRKACLAGSFGTES